MMDAESLKAVQVPLKQRYVDSPEDAIALLHAEGTVNFDDLTCDVTAPFTEQGLTKSGLHEKAGGDGAAACAGDMLLQSVVACAGVTLAVVKTAMRMEVQSAVVRAKGTMDFRGTLGVDRSVPIGLTGVELLFEITSDEDSEQLDKLVELAERYCVIAQTLKASCDVKAIRQSSTEP